MGDKALDVDAHVVVRVRMGNDACLVHENFHVIITDAETAVVLVAEHAERLVLAAQSVKAAEHKAGRWSPARHKKGGCGSF